MAAPASAQILATHHASPTLPSSQSNMIQQFPTQQPIAGPSRYNGQSSQAQSFIPSIFPHLNTANLPANVNLNDPEVLQRILLAQQGQQRHQPPQQQQQHKQPLQQQFPQNAQSVQRRPSGGVDGSGVGNSAAPLGLGNLQEANKEAIIRQMQALQNSQAVRNHNAQNGAIAVAAAASNLLAPQADGPRSSVARSPASTGLPASSQNGGSSKSVDSPSSGLPQSGSDTALQSQSASRSAALGIKEVHPSELAMATGAQLTEEQKQFLRHQQEQMRAAQQQQAQQGSQPAASTGNPSLPPHSSAQPGPRASGVRPPPSLSDQRRQFIASLVVFHQQNEIPLPAAVFNGERDGSVKVGPAWVEVFDLFAMVMRNGGAANALRLPAESPAWVGLLTSKGIPKLLPEPLQLALPADAQPMSTTNPVQYLVSIYLTCLRGFEDHLVRQRTTLQNRQAVAVTATGKPSLPLSDTGPAHLPPALSASSPATAMLPESTPERPPETEYPSDLPVSITRGTSDAPKTLKTIGGNAARKSKAKPPTPTFQTALPAPTAQASNGARAGTPDSAASGKQRKRDRKEAKPPESMLLTNITPSAIAVHNSVGRPPTPKRVRYKVEYRPLHHPSSSMGGWDERAVASTFSKNKLHRSTRSIHELGVVDMEAVLMGLRSRLPRELGYALTVLSMLSMPHPEEKISGLPLLHLSEIYMEILDLMSEAAFGEGGYDVWHQERFSHKDKERSRLSFLDLERLGRDTDLGLTANQEYRDQTGGETDIILACLNILRNFSILPENQPILARPPELCVLLSRISDLRLCRFGDGAIGPGKPYSVLELARVRRDCVVILGHVGQYVGLSRLPFDSVQSTYCLLASFLTDGCEHTLSIDNIYGPSTSTQDSPPPVILSIYRAVEAFGKLAASDVNREVLSRLPASDLIHLFAALIKLLPITKRAQEAMHTIEDFLGYTECIALALYSLVFLAPAPSRAAMCSVPGAISIITQLIFDTGPRTYDFKTNPFAVLCRRLCETLGVLNGTMSASGGMQDMSFSAGGGGGKGWKFASDVVDRGLLAGFAERVGELCSIKGLDGPAFGELDGMWWDPKG